MVKTMVKKRRPFRRYKTLSQQVIRIKLDWGANICFVNSDEAGDLIFDTQAAHSTKEFNEIMDNAKEISRNENLYTQFFQRQCLYGIKIYVTPTKPTPTTQTFGATCYVGWINGKTGNAPSIDICRSMDTAWQLPSYGSGPLVRFRRLKGMPWIESNYTYAGYFFVRSNAAQTRSTGPMWEIRCSLYIKYTGNSL